MTWNRLPISSFVYTPYSQIKYINKSLFILSVPYILPDAMNSSGSQSSRAAAFLIKMRGSAERKISRCWGYSLCGVSGKWAFFILLTNSVVPKYKP
ncbi:MAG: hypothetical protein PF482_13715, partial [Desulfobacteraceae bacterium]|nr:hypothetical protein [Desulfobacteraceae bacterium]